MSKKSSRCAALLFVVAWIFVEPAVCHELFDSFNDATQAIAYSPRSYSPAPESEPIPREQIVSDLDLLYETGFRSLVTYTSTGAMGDVPELARKAGFDGFIIMGIWDPTSEEEWSNALTQAPFVNGYCVGNEGLQKRYNKVFLAERMKALRKASGRPVTTSEPIDAYLSGPQSSWLISESDWLFPTAHPYWAMQLKPSEAVNWVVARYDYLAATSGKAVLIKEAGFPGTVGDGQRTDQQVDFFSALETTGIPFVYFEAFDQPWKSDFEGKPAIEAHWGLFNEHGSPKDVVSWLRNHWHK
jgi:exo-beta-1,3-glucanase (GH17 family)